MAQFSVPLFVYISLALLSMTVERERAKGSKRERKFSRFLLFNNIDLQVRMMTERSATEQKPN